MFKFDKPTGNTKRFLNYFGIKSQRTIEKQHNKYQYHLASYMSQQIGPFEWRVQIGGLGCKLGGSTDEYGNKMATGLGNYTTSDYDGNEETELRLLISEMEDDLCEGGYGAVHGIATKEKMPMYESMGYKFDGIQEDFDDLMVYKILECEKRRREFVNACAHNNS